jgi:hypothetical protein
MITVRLVRALGPDRAGRLDRPAGDRRYLGQRGPGRPDDALFLGRLGEISSRGLQHMLRRLKGRVGGRSSYVFR